MTFVKLWHLSTDVKAHILVVNKEMAALSPKNRMVFIRIGPDATRNFVQKNKMLISFVQNSNANSIKHKNYPLNT